MLSVRENQLSHRLPQRVHNVGDETHLEGNQIFFKRKLVKMAYLALCHVDGVPVAERRDLEALLSLLVSLVEALLHQAVDPLGVEGQRLGRVGQVATVDQVLEHLDSVVLRKRCIKGG